MYYPSEKALHLEIIINQALIDLLVSKAVITQETIEKIEKTECDLLANKNWEVTVAE